MFCSCHRVGTGGGVKTLSTSSVRLCEKKDDVVLSNQDEKTNADPTESPALAQHKAEEDGEVINMAEQRDEPAVLKTDDGGAMLQQVDEKIKQDVAKPEQVMTDAAKSGKESLLDLLGAMKVEVTNKRRLKSLKAQKNYESIPRSNPAAMESTISMFQKATEEASSQR